MYQLIAKELRERIGSGELPPGRPAPNRARAQGRMRCAAKHRQGRGQVPRYSQARPSPSRDGGRSSPGGSGRSSPPEGHGVAEVGHRDLIQVRPPTEDEAGSSPSRTTAASRSCPVCVPDTGTPAEGGRRSWSPAPCFRPTAMSSAAARAWCPLRSPPPRRAAQRLSRRRGYAPREPENGHAIASRGRGPSDSQRTRCHWVSSRAPRQARLGA
jgi:hypothetical protein